MTGSSCRSQRQCTRPWTRRPRSARPPSRTTLQPDVGRQSTTPIGSSEPVGSPAKPNLRRSGRHATHDGPRTFRGHYLDCNEDASESSIRSRAAFCVFTPNRDHRDPTDGRDVGSGRYDTRWENPRRPVRAARRRVRQSRAQSRGGGDGVSAISSSSPSISSAIGTPTLAGRRSPKDLGAIARRRLPYTCPDSPTRRCALRSRRGRVGRSSWSRLRFADRTARMP